MKTFQDLEKTNESLRGKFCYEIASITATLYKENDSFILRLVKYLSEMTEEQKKVLKHFIEMMAKKEPLD